MAERHVTIPLMVKNDEDIQFVEDDNDTVSENEPSSGAVRVTSENYKRASENLYTEIPQQETRVSFLKIPKRKPVSRSPSTESSDVTLPVLERSSSARRKYHDYEKVSVTSSGSKKSAVERITEGAFFRRRNDATYDSRRSESKVDDEEHILETLRQVVRKCTNVDPVKRPASGDVLYMLSTTFEKP
ncbi:hypothetical protein X975_10450, partial [Stegodyphus mimosarum]